MAVAILLFVDLPAGGASGDAAFPASKNFFKLIDIDFTTHKKVSHRGLGIQSGKKPFHSGLGIGLELLGGQTRFKNFHGPRIQQIELNFSKARKLYLSK